jgi:phage-related protein
LPTIESRIFQDDDGQVPLLDWLDQIPNKAKDKCLIRIERLEELGYDLRRPEADYLRDGIYELRTRVGTVNYRILYFFFKQEAVILSHGLTKENDVPDKEIDLAVVRKKKFEKNPKMHTYIFESEERDV